MTAKAICHCNACGDGIYDMTKAMVYPPVELAGPPAIVCHRCEMRKNIKAIWAKHARWAWHQPDELIQTILKICGGRS